MSSACPDQSSCSLPWVPRAAEWAWSSGNWWLLIGILEKSISMSSSTAEHPCLLVRKGREGKSPRLPYMQGKWLRGINKVKLANPRGTRQHPPFFSHEQESGGCCPEDLCLEMCCGVVTEYPGPTQGALQVIPWHENRVKMGRCYQTSEGEGSGAKHASKRAVDVLWQSILRFLDCSHCFGGRDAELPSVPRRLEDIQLLMAAARLHG